MLETAVTFALFFACPLVLIRIIVDTFWTLFLVYRWHVERRDSKSAMQPHVAETAPT